MNGKPRVKQENDDGLNNKTDLTQTALFHRNQRTPLFFIQDFSLKEGKTVMNTFLRQGIIEHRRKTEMKNNFIEHNRKAADIVSRMPLLTPDAPDYLKKFEQRCLILLAPLIETAWADGGIKAREMDAIFWVAETYGFDQDEESYGGLIDSMMTKATPAQSETLWQKFHEVMRHLPLNERESLGFCLMMQARFVAEKSSNNSISYLRGDLVAPAETEVLQKILGELEKLRQNLEETIMQNQTIEENCVGKLTANELNELLPLVPLVKVAWAEGRITKREREFIFRKAQNLGIAPGTNSFQRLSDWLELHPTDEFYLESLELLRENLTKLPEEERGLLHLDLISDCVNIAEASGGTRRYEAGGPRVCEEEFAAVKRIADKIKVRAASVAV